jgi:2-oxoglutarate dehydrogenase E1 component
VDAKPYFDAPNAAYVQAVFEQFLQNPGSVAAEWRQLFEDGGAAALVGESVASVVPAPAATSARGQADCDVDQLRAARAAGELVDAYRLHGHRAARIDPLGSEPTGHPELQPEYHGIAEADLSAVSTAFMNLPAPGHTLADALGWLRETYAGPIGYEFEHLEDPEHRAWLREQIESGAHRQPLAPDERRRLLERLTEVEAFEQFIHRSYLGAKRFSIEGLDVMVPVLDLAIERASAAGAREITIGMAHRGRLNVLAHVLGMSYGDMIAKFEGRHSQLSGTGDVKYHLGSEGTYATRSGEPLTVLLAPNPSHLEFVHPVVEGMTRAKQTDRTQSTLAQDENLVVPIVIHGDTAFPGQGVVAETLNFMRLGGYRVGGTLHVIANNQIGFTTTPGEARSTDYASDLARGFDIPIFHVNADDPEACLAVARLAMAYRERFHSDVVIDLIGYRRFGHNEGDEPAYTQPLMYQQIAGHAPVRRLYAERLVAASVLDDAETEAIWQRAYQRLLEEQGRVRDTPEPADHDREPEFEPEPDVATRVSADRLIPLDRALHRWPEGFQLNPKLARQLERRSRVVPEGGALDWGHAEALAFATLLTEHVPVRLTGQDVERGTFSHRHQVLHDIDSNTEYAPLAHLDGAQAAYEVHNSPLSELAAVAFEYGYSVVTPRALVLWEAQFGDFVNGAQVIIDQFIAAGRAKWGQESRLVLLLPHGYEGQGPEHSSARLERFLQLCAEHNLRVANCTTPAQYFHLLRYQALQEAKRPLIVMTPKSLLRHPRAVSSVADFTEGSFRRVLDDDGADPARAKRIVLCTGKIYYDLLAAREKRKVDDVALVRAELLYPFPADELRAVFARYGPDSELVWVQEEPRNMGAWRHMAPRLEALLDGRRVRYVGRPERASPAEGFANSHEEEQQRIAQDALAVEAVTGVPRRA